MHYTNIQVMLSLSYIAYAKCLSTNEETIYRRINDFLNIVPTLEGYKNLVWGPAIYRFNNSSTTDNLIYIVQNENDKSKYTIAIRGTNPVSLQDIFLEDLKVEEQIPWKYNAIAKANGAKISLGTNIGLLNLLTMKPAMNIPGSGQTLKEFFTKELETNDSKNNTIAITGHSLAGALAPALALNMFDTKNKWDKNNKIKKIEVYPFAGPTSGNKEFADYYNKVLGNTTTRVALDLDIVPHVWNIDEMKKIRRIYTPTFRFRMGLIIWLVYRKLCKRIKTKGYTHINSSTKEYKGEVFPYVLDYLAQAIYQHTIGYLKALKLDDIDEFENIFKEIGIIKLKKVKKKILKFLKKILPF